MLPYEATLSLRDKDDQYVYHASTHQTKAKLSFVHMNKWVNKVQLWWINNRYLKREPLDDFAIKLGLSEHQMQPLYFIYRGSPEWVKEDHEKYLQWLEQFKHKSSN